MAVFHAGLKPGTRLGATVPGQEDPGRGRWVASAGCGSLGHRQPFSAAPGKRTAAKPCFERARNKCGLLCGKGHVDSVFRIHAASGISQSSDFNGGLQGGSLEYFDLFGHRADLQPAALTVVVVF